MPQETRQKISNSLKNRPKSQVWKDKISAGLKKAWAAIPSEQDNSDFTKTERIVKPYIILYQ